MTQNILEMRDIDKGFNGVPVLKHVNLDVRFGEVHALCGENGAGKSTLMKILAGRLEPDSGRVTVRGGTRIGYLDQSDVLDDDHTVGYAIVGDTPEYEWASQPRIRDVILGPGFRSALGCTRLFALWRSASTRSARLPARAGVGRADARRAHQPPGR